MAVVNLNARRLSMGRLVGAAVLSIVVLCLLRIPSATSVRLGHEPTKDARAQSKVVTRQSSRTPPLAYSILDVAEVADNAALVIQAHVIRKVIRRSADGKTITTCLDL